MLRCHDDVFFVGLHPTLTDFALSGLRNNKLALKGRNIKE